VCAYQRKLVASEGVTNGHARPMTLTAEAGALATPIEPIQAPIRAQMGL
jgi:hypothetical protein